MHVAKMTKSQVKFRLKRMQRDMDFLFMNAPCTVSPMCVEKVHKIVDKYAKKCNVKV